MGNLKIIGFIIFAVGACLKLWWVIVLGWMVFEAGGVAWMAAVTSDEHGHKDHGNHLDHGP